MTIKYLMLWDRFPPSAPGQGWYPATLQGFWGRLAAGKGVHGAHLALLPSQQHIPVAGKRLLLQPRLCPCILWRAGAPTHSPVCQPRDVAFLQEQRCSSKPARSQASPRAPGLKPVCDLCIQSGTLLLPPGIIKQGFGLRLRQKHRSTPAQLQPVVILLSPAAATLHPQRGFEKGRGKPRAGESQGGAPQNCRHGVQPHISIPSKEGSPIFPGTGGCHPLRRDAWGGMLGEARSHSSALLLRAAGDWRRVTSPLPRHGNRASPAIFGSGTSAYRQEAHTVPPHECPRGKGSQAGGGQQGPHRKVQARQPGLDGGCLTGRAGWWQRGG